MCTVTIFPIGKNDFVLTSNRDEAPDRLPLIPDFYVVKDNRLLFPKDIKGGTWVGVSENNRVVCLLNGGFKKHEREDNYIKSRGIVVNDFLVCNKIESSIKAYKFNGIEPFTMVIADWNSGLKFYELVWDGIKKHFNELPLEPKIWSSSTLYTQVMKNSRKMWFDKLENYNVESLLKFHGTKDESNLDYGIVMDRGLVKTTSITQIVKQGARVIMRYENLRDNKVYTKAFNLPEVVNG
ncbi:NRDE family protein [Algibacter pectinivorans]|uniref:Transport and Golgi organisation 2 n=1 Tax=Algibacter pectinivorans TaxID=870482 RepID=A0A1I1Q8Y8_9FLAO|nr:NRDE family protein [Algibacter pectinivorans]SFD15683.1 Transport and Golgi organisation 2 [Algibacter pectinivorans]